MSPGWREAWGNVWEAVTGVRGGRPSQLWRSGFLALLTLGSLWVLYQCFATRAPESRGLAPSVPSVEAERQRLHALVHSVRAASAARAGGGFWVKSMREMGKYIFDEPGEPARTPQEEAPPPLPRITVKAVMVMGKDRAAVVDIAGGGAGLILRPGDRFLGGKGRVLRVEKGGIVVQWGGRDWDIMMN